MYASKVNRNNNVRGISIKKSQIIRSENKFRKKLRAYIVYCFRISTAHGMIQVVRKKRHPCEKLFWALIIALALVPCILLGKQACDHYWHNPTVTDLERDHWQWETYFPSITACPRSILDGPFESLADEENIEEESRDRFKEFLSELFYGNYSTYGTLAEFKEEFGHIDSEKYTVMNWKLASLGGDTTFEFYDDERAVDKTMTEYGYCFTYNNAISPYNTLEYWNDSNYINNETNADILTTALESPLYKISQVECELKLFFHGTNEIIDILTKSYTLMKEFMSIIQINSISTWTPDDVKRLTVSQRNCRFREESNLKYSPVYTFKLCKIDCRSRLAVHLCKCMPFYYQRMYGEKVCDIDGMICLSKHAYTLLELKDAHGNSICDCMQNCNEDMVIIWSMDTREWFFGTFIQIFFLFTNNVRYKRSIIFSETDLLVQIGGVTGLCFGLSILSAMEFFYFLTLRFYWGVVKDRTL